MSEDIRSTDIISSAAESLGDEVVFASSAPSKSLPARTRPRHFVAEATSSKSVAKPRARLRTATMSDGETDRKRHKLTYDRTPVACTNCRHRKIRCIPTDDGDGTECANCRKMNKECLFVPVQRPETEAPVRTKKTSKKGKKKNEDEATSANTNDVVRSSPSEVESYVDHSHSFAAMEVKQPSEDPTGQHTPQDHSSYPHYVHHSSNVVPMQWEQLEHAHHYSSIPGSVTMPEAPVADPYGILPTPMDYASYSNSTHSASTPAPHAWPQDLYGVQYGMAQAQYYPSANATPAAHQYHDTPQGPAHAPVFQPLYEAQASHVYPYVPMHGATEHTTHTTTPQPSVWHAHQYAPTTDDGSHNPG